MQLIEPEILADASGLALGLSVCGLLLGMALWLLGWRRHRFWVVLTITLVGGVYGLNEAPALRAPPAVAGVLLALGAGTLALALARLFAFAAAGIAALLAVQAFVPTWDQPLISFMTGGLLGVLLYRLWVMVLTSLAGALLMTYASLCLAERFTKLATGDFAAKHTTLLNWICGGLAGLGVLLQVWLNRGKSGQPPAADHAKKPEPKPPAADHGDKPPAKRAWLGWPPFLKAG